MTALHKQEPGSGEIWREKRTISKNK